MVNSTPTSILPAKSAYETDNYFPALAVPTEEFQKRGYRLFRYLWQCGKVRFLRLPSGLGIYTRKEQLIAVGFPEDEFPYSHGKGYYLKGSDPALFPDFRPLPLEGMLSIAAQRESFTEKIKLMDDKSLCRWYGQVPVCTEDAYAGGNCWYGSKRWEAVIFQKVAPLLHEVVAMIERIPLNNRPELRAACIMAAAYVVGGPGDKLAFGVMPQDIEEAMRRGQKADTIGTDRNPRLFAKQITAPKPPKGRRPR